MRFAYVVAACLALSGAAVAQTPADLAAALKLTGDARTKALVEGAPKTLKEGVSQSEADEIKTKLTEAGATVELK